MHETDAHHSIDNPQLAHRQYLPRNLSLEMQAQQSQQSRAADLVKVAGESAQTAVLVEQL